MANNVEVLKIGDILNEKIRVRYSEDSILSKYGICDNEVATRMLAGKTKVLKKWKDIYNPNMNVIFPEISELIPVTPPGVLNDTIYNKEIVKRYCNDIIGWNPIDNPDKAEELLRNIQSKNLKIAVIGYGGAMINFLYFVYLLTYYANFNEPIFEEIAVFEKENIAFTNLLRLGKPLVLKNYLDIFVENQDIPTIKKLYLLEEEQRLTKNIIIQIDGYLEDQDDIDELKNQGYILIGAPNFAARQLLEQNDMPFFFFGHANNELEIFYQPVVDSDLTVESYGSIDIPVLLSNIAVGTIAQLQIWNDMDLENNPFEKSQSLFRIDMGEWLDSKNEEKIDD